MKLCNEIPGVNGVIRVISYQYWTRTLTLKNIDDSTGVDMQAHDEAMHETTDTLCWIGAKSAISMCRFEEVSASDQVRLRQLDQCPVKVLGLVLSFRRLVHLTRRG